MSRMHPATRGALLAGAVAFAAGCHGDSHLSGPSPRNAIFDSYVALGNSITAGYQSGGINDSTQQQSYAVLLAKQMGTRFAYPSFLAPGCPPPINNFLTLSRVGGASSTSTSCAFRNPASVTATLNNVAVPGIASADPTAVVGPSDTSNALAALILGGKTMVQKALDNHPTFATAWIGNNDILGPALNGLIGTATPVNTFMSNYAKDINALVNGAPAGLKGALIGVVQVANAPILFPAAALTDPNVIAAASQVAGRPVSLDPTSCAGANIGALVNFQYLVAIKSRPGAPANGQVFCAPVAGGGANDPGDNGILDINEQASVTATINGYNAYIHAKADSIGFVYFDPNPIITTLKSAGSIPTFPNLAAPTAPFGQYITLDGIHPSGAAHLLIANGLIDAINAKYGTTLQHAQ